MLTKGNFTRDEWNHLLCLFNISHFSSAECSQVMSKRTQKESGEERVTAKSRPMMNLIARSNERAPSALSSTASESPEKTRHENQNLLSPQAEKYNRTETPAVCSQRASQTPFSRQCKNVILEEEANHDRTGRPAVCSQRAHQFVIEDDETESELSLGSRSFLRRVNDQVRKRQKQSSADAIEDSDKHSVTWRMFMSSTLQASVFMEKNYSDNLHSIKNTEDLTRKQMFDTSEKLVSEQSDEIYGVKTIDWEDSSWKYLSLIGDEQVISLQRTKVYVFSDSAWKDEREPSCTYGMGTKIGVVQKFTRIQSFGQN